MTDHSLESSKEELELPLLENLKDLPCTAVDHKGETSIESTRRYKQRFPLSQRQSPFRSPKGYASMNESLPQIITPANKTIKKTITMFKQEEKKTKKNYEENTYMKFKKHIMRKTQNKILSNRYSNN